MDTALIVRRQQPSFVFRSFAPRSSKGPERIFGPDGVSIIRHPASGLVSYPFFRCIARRSSLMGTFCLGRPMRILTMEVRAAARPRQSGDWRIQQLIGWVDIGDAASGAVRRKREHAGSRNCHSATASLTQCVPSTYAWLARALMRTADLMIRRVRMAVSSEIRPGFLHFAQSYSLPLCDPRTPMNCGTKPYLARAHRSRWFLIYTPPPLRKRCCHDIGVTTSLILAAKIESL